MSATNQAEPPSITCAFDRFTPQQAEVYGYIKLNGPVTAREIARDLDHIRAVPGVVTSLFERCAFVDRRQRPVRQRPFEYWVRRSPRDSNDGGNVDG